MGNQCKGCMKEEVRSKKPARLQIIETAGTLEKYAMKCKLGRHEQKFMKMQNIENKKDYAVRSYKKSEVNESQLELLKKEFSILRVLDHPNIVKPHQIINDKDYLYFIYQYYDGGNLLEYIGIRNKLSEDQAGTIIQSFLRTMSYIQFNYILHRNLKLESIVFQKRDGNITDFRICSFSNEKSIKKFQEKQNQRVNQIFYYVAPQIFNGKPASPASEVYAMGIIIFRILVGLQKRPFLGDKNIDVLKVIKEGNLNKKALSQAKVPKQAIQLITKMVALVPQKRLTLSQCLQNPWVLKYSGRKVELKGNYEENINQMSNFYKASRLSISVQQFIYEKYHDQQEAQRLSAIFKRIDKNLDGSLSKEQVQQARNDPSLNESTRILIQEILRNFPEENITYSNFLLALANKQKLINEARIVQIFKKIDVDNTGTIQKQQLINVMKGEQNQQVMRMIQEADTNGDGIISLQEWKHLILQNL